MSASRPAARAALAIRQARATPVDPLAPRLRFLRGFDPADPIIAGQRRNIFPGRQCFRVKFQRLLQISGKVMDAAARDVCLVSHMALSQRQSMSATGGKRTFLLRYFSFAAAVRTARIRSS